MKNQKVCVIVLLSILFAGCSSFSQSQRDADYYAAANSQSVNDARKVNQYFAKMNPVSQKTNEGAGKIVQPVKVTIAQAVDKYVPADFKVFIDSDVNTKSLLAYNPSLPWIDAFGESLTEIGVEANANLYKKTINLTSLKTPLSEVLEKYVPSNFYVYQDPRINDSATVKYDKSLYWLEALSKIGADLGIEVSTNLTNRTVHLKPLGAAKQPSK